MVVSTCMFVSSQDFLNISLGIGFLVLVGFVSYLCWQLVFTLKSIRRVVENTEDIIRDIRTVKNQLKTGLAAGLATTLSILNSILKKKNKRG